MTRAKAAWAMMMTKAVRWATVMVVGLAFAILVGLGNWQVKRLGEKRDLLMLMDERLQGPPVTLPAKVDHPAGWAYRLVAVMGHFRHQDERYVYAIGHRQPVPGYHVITPLERADGTWVLVNRGWVPTALKDPVLRPAGQVEGLVTIAGVARPSRSGGWFTPPDEPARRIFYAPRIDALSAGLSVAVLPLIVEAGPAPVPGGWPQGGVTRLDIPNDHLQYALTWYGLAAVMAVIALLMWRRTRAVARGRRDH